MSSLATGNNYFYRTLGEGRLSFFYYPLRLQGTGWRHS